MYVNRHCELAKQSIVFFWIASQARNDEKTHVFKENAIYVVKKRYFCHHFQIFFKKSNKHSHNKLIP